MNIDEQLEAIRREVEELDALAVHVRPKPWREHLRYVRQRLMLRYFRLRATYSLL